MSQPRHHSAIETAVSTLVGFWISYWLNYALLPAFSHRVTHRENFQIVVIFTVVSLIRGYILRRTFNRLNTLLTKDSK